jgi:AbrB family looped-hinge helix DNA binding protein
MSFSKISTKGWVVIPAEMRRRYGLKPGMRLQVVDYGGVVSLIPLLKDSIKQTAGMLKGKTALTKALLDEHAEEAQHEQRARRNIHPR